MAVTSSTVGGVNCWQFSGAVTDAELKTAWAALIVNGVYVLNRAIYLDNTADLTGLNGGFLVSCGTQVYPAFILNTARDKTKSMFKNFTFLQSVGLSNALRHGFVQTWNGVTLSGPEGADGLSLSGGGIIYGAPDSGDFQNEMSLAELSGATIYSQEFTGSELRVVTSKSGLLKGVTFEKCSGFPQVVSTSSTGNVNIVVYRSTENTQNLYPLRLFPVSGPYAAICYVDSYVTRNGADITTGLADFYASSATNRAVLVILNNYTRESWFGATKTSFVGLNNFHEANQIWGGVLKKLQFVGGDGAVIRAYDSRSTTAAQKCAFLESGSVDFLDSSLAPMTDSTGKISLVHIGALATGGAASITRYTGQKYTFQKFGYRVSVTDVDMTQGGDNDLSAFTPVIPVAQEGIARTQAAITAATELTSFQDLLEELHVLAIGLSGSTSYAGAFGGNLASFVGAVLTTSFTTVNVDATAASKISYNSATNTLTIKATTLTSNSAVSQWVNSGAVNLLNGAKIQGIYGAGGVLSTTLELRDIKPGAAYIIANNATKATILYGTNSTGTTQTYTVQFPPGSAGTEIYMARKTIGDFFDFEVVTLEEGFVWQTFTDIPDEGAKETNPTVLNAYTALETNTKVYNYVTGIYQRTEEGIKLGEFFLREGKQLKWAAPFSGKVKKDNASLFSKSGDLFTIKANVLASDENYDTNIFTPPATLTAGTDEIIGTNVEDANGNSQATVAGTVNSLVDVWKITNATPVADFATGTKIASNIGNGKFRFIGVDGFKLVFNNKDNGVYRYCSMSKGNYNVGWFLYDLPTGGLTQEQSDVLNSLNTKNDDIFNDVNKLMDGFVDGTDSLHAIREAINAKPSLADIEASTVLAKKSQLASATEIATAVEVAIINEGDGQQVLKAIADKIGNENVTATVIAQTVRTELTTELGRIDTPISSRLATTGYTAPANEDIAAIKAKTNTLVNGPTLENIEASTVLAKAGAVVDANIVKVNNVAVDGTGVDGDEWGPAGSAP